VAAVTVAMGGVAGRRVKVDALLHVIAVAPSVVAVMAAPRPVAVVAVPAVVTAVKVPALVAPAVVPAAPATPVAGRRQTHPQKHQSGA
jgi:hypothetical protein